MTDAVATAMARELALRSKTGLPGDPLAYPADLVPEHGGDGRALTRACLELVGRGLASWRKDNKLSPTLRLFEEADRDVMGSDPKRDALALARALAARVDQVVTAQDLAAELAWSARRLNPALAVLDRCGVFHFVGRAPSADASGAIRHAVVRPEAAALAASGGIPAADGHAGDEDAPREAWDRPGTVGWEVSRKIRLPLAGIDGRFVLSARRRTDGAVVLGVFNTGAPPWASDPAHELHRPGTVFVNVGDVLSSMPWLRHPIYAESLDSFRDGILRRVADVVVAALGPPLRDADADARPTAGGTGARRPQDQKEDR